MGFSQSGNKVKADYNSQKGFNKVVFYENLSLNQKRSYRDFFYINFPKLSSNVEIQSNKNNQIRYKFSLAEVYNIKGEELKSLETLKEIQNDKDYQLSPTEHMNVLVSLQKSYLNLNLYSNVFRINSEIATLRKSGADFPLWSYNLKSSLYARLQLYDKAIPQLKSEINDLFKNPKRDSLIIPSAYNDLGFYYSRTNNIDSSYYYFNLSLKKAEQSIKNTDFETYQRLTGVTKGNMAVLKIMKKDYQSAIPLLEEDAKIGLENNDDPDGTARSLILLAECYSNIENYSKAQEVISKVEELLKTELSPQTKVSYFKAKAELLKKLNQNEEAYIYYQKAFKLGDSLNIIKQKLLLAGNDILYQMEEKDNLIEKQQANINATQKSFLSILVLSLGIILATTLFFLNNSRKKRKEIEQKNAEISAKNITINESLAEKELLLKEIHHRVKNNLQVISGILSLQNNSISDEKAKQILVEGQDRIQTIALLHKTMYQDENFNVVSFKTYIQELITYIKQTNITSHKNITIHQEIEDVHFNIDTAIPLSLIINEIITNCYKHAFENKNEGIISISIKKQINLYELIIEDNGIGLPENFNTNDYPKSIGFDLIQGLCQQIDGEIKISNTNGTKINIQFKEPS